MTIRECGCGGSGEKGKKPVGGKSQAVALAVAGLVLFSGAANAAPKHYGKLQLGYGLINSDKADDTIKFKPALNFEGAYGLDVAPDVRTELSYTYGFEAKEKEDGELKQSTMAIMIRGYYDISAAKFSGITPFVGIGIGVKQGDIENEYVDEGVPVTESDTSTWGFAYDFTVGLSYAATSNLNVDLSFLYGQAKVNYKDMEAKPTINEGSVKLGARFSF